MWPHKKSPSPSSEEDSTSIGNFVVGHQLCSRERLIFLIAEFNDILTEDPFGKFLVAKGILSEEKLQILLLKQAAERNGGVEHSHIVKALALAELTLQKVSEGVDRLNLVTAAAAAKGLEPKP